MICLGPAFAVAAQPGIDCVTGPENATVVFPADLSAALGAAGEPLAPGDEIIFVTAAGTCVGRGTWTPKGTHVSVAGAIRPEDAGHQPDDSLRVRIRDTSADLAYAVDRIAFKACPPGIPCSSEGRYVADGLLFVSRLQAASPRFAASRPYVVTEPHPNPAGRCAQFEVTLAHEQLVRIDMYNTLGQRVRRVHQGVLAAKRPHPVRVCPERLASGAYFVRVAGPSFAATRRITFVR